MNKLKLTGLLAGPLLCVLVYALLVANTSLEASACKVLAVGTWMVCWWVTEAVHLSVTALVPMVMLPAVGVISVQQATSAYGNPVIFLFMGGFLLALGLEKHNLHQRIALNLIRLTGTSGNGIILGFTLATSLISMWISNTATTIMMLPIAVSVSELLKDDLAGSTIDHRSQVNFGAGLMLSIAYSASIGGMATIIGTPPNVVAVGLYRDAYQQDITFTEWLKIGLPVSVVILAACYLLITRVAFPNRIKNVPGSAELVQRRLASLGALSRAERIVLFIFLITSVGWIFRPYVNDFLNLLFFTGGNREILDDTLIAMGGGILMFVIPSDLKKGEFLLTWEDTKRLPWGILILFGGGMCLARSLEEAGLIQRIGDYIASFGTIQVWLLVFILAFLSLFLTEIMSNVALTTIFVPVVFGIANSMHYPPLLLALPVTFAASCAFTMPVSTPPNAIVFASGLIGLRQMMRAGLLLNLIGLIVIVLMTLLLADRY